MGWTYQTPTHFKYDKYGQRNVDRKAECDERYSNDGKWKVLKSTMVGTVYYAAVDNGKEVFCGIALTGIEHNEYGLEFRHKDMAESEGPFQYDCPTSILDLLSPTDNKNSLEWRVMCRKYKAESALARKRAKALKQARHISITFERDWNFHDAGTTITLTLTPYMGKDVWVIDGDNHYIRQSDIVKLGYKVLEEAA